MSVYNMTTLQVHISVSVGVGVGVYVCVCVCVGVCVCVCVWKIGGFIHWNQNSNVHTQISSSYDFHPCYSPGRGKIIPKTLQLASTVPISKWCPVNWGKAWVVEHNRLRWSIHEVRRYKQKFWENLLALATSYPTRSAVNTC